jgi:hypothetical protein
MLKRHEIQVLQKAGHTWMEIAGLSGVSVRTVRRSPRKSRSPRSITPRSGPAAKSGARKALLADASTVPQPCRE